MGESHGQDSADESSGNEENGKRGGGGGGGDGGGGTSGGDGEGGDSASPPNRTKSNQRWMKLRTTVQLSGAITSTIQKKPPLKREDSFLKRFSTRQIPELQETVDTGDDGEGDSEGNSGGVKSFVKIHRRKRRKYQKPPITVVNPDGDFFYYWMMLVTICVLYNLWTLIVRQSFPELQDSYSGFWFSCDLISDSVFLLDIAVQFRTGYLEQGLMVYDWKKLAGHYMKSKAFLLDLGAIFPLELLQYNYGTMPILRCPRFFKVHRVYAYYYIVESRTVYPNVLRVMNLIHILLILAHWFGCFYYLLSEYENFQGDWVYPYRPGAYATLTRKYLASLYWSTLTLTTIGDLPTPETNAENETDRLQNVLRRGHKTRLLQYNSNLGYVFTIVGYLIGVFIFATIVGQVGNVITNRNANRLEFERLLDGAKTYMRHHKVPGGMKRRVLRWYDYSWSRGRIQGGGDINTALGLLPDKLKTELALHVNLSVLKKVTIFQECQPEFLHDLVLKMKAYIFTPGDLICRKGEVAREMFIIADGILEVMSETGRVLTTMKAGDFFGEIGILNLDGLNKRTADVRSVGYSELFSLSREDVLNAMKDYPEAQEILQSLGRKRLKEAQNMNRAWKNSAGQQREKKMLSINNSDNIGDINNRSRLDKLRLDVKELRNVLRKSGKNSRALKECMELEPLTRSLEGGSNKGVLSRMPRIYNDDTSYEDDNPPSPPKLGAGLPLLQRLKLLKEKQDAEKLESKKLVPSTPLAETPEKKEVDTSSLPLLQRILLLKQKEDAEKNAMQNTANMAAQVLASTVKSQGTAPPQPLVKLKTKTSEDNPKPLLKSGVKFRELVRIGGGRKSSASESISRDASSDAPSTKHRSTSCSSADDVSASKRSSQYMNQNQDSTDNESWKLIKKAVVQPISSTEPTGNRLTVDVAYTSTVRKELSIVREDNVNEKTNSEILDDKVSTPSNVENTNSAVLSSVTRTDCSSTTGGKKLQLAQFIRNAQGKKEVSHPERTKDDKSAQKLNLGNLDKKPLSRDSRFPKKSISAPSRKTEKVKIYKSIDDLSPEYSGLPFVKKLKILNERQKLAELERNTFIRSCSLDSASGGGDDSDLGETLTRSHSEAIAMEVVLRNQHTRQMEEMNAEMISLDEDDSKTIIQLGSPESNETEERRELKSILKKLSSGSLMQNVCGSTTETEFASSSGQLIPDIKKLMRAQTIEGYAARHSKFTKSVTFNRVAVESSSSPSTPSSDNVFLESSPNETPSNQMPPNEAHPVTVEAAHTERNEPVGDEDGSSFDSSTMVNPDVIPTSISISNVKEDHFVTTASISDESVPVGSPQRYSPRLFSPALVIEHSHNQTFSNITSIRDFNQGDKMECFGHFFGEIRQLLEDHLEKIECQYARNLENLEQEVRKRDIIISQLQRRIQELEGAEIGTSSTNGSLDYGDHPFLRGVSVDTVLHGETVRDSDEHPEPEEPEPWSRGDGGPNILLPMLPTEAVKECTYLNIGVESSSTDTDDDIKYNNDWEVQMLAQELTEREEGNRRRAVSFDSAQPSRKDVVHRTRSFDHGRKPPSDQVITAKSLDALKKPPTISPYHRSLSISSIQKTFSSTWRRGLHFMRNGMPSSPDVVPTISRSVRLPSHLPSTNKSNP